MPHAPAPPLAALVTGTRRLGAGVAIALAARGFDVGLVYHESRDEAETAAARVESLGRRAVLVQADLSRPEACRSVIESAVEAFNRLDALVCLASRFVRVPIEQIDRAEWDASLAVDLSASFFCAQAAVPHLRATHGTIVLCSDWVAASGRPRYRGYVPYFVAKRGVIALGEALGLELAGDGIRVHVIAPGPILPIAGSTEREQQAVLAATPLGRWGGVDEVGRAVAALLASTFVTGETIRIDGGRHLA